MDGLPRTFPRRLRAARENRQLSQAALAERAGLQPAAVSHFETGQRTPSCQNLRRLADALAVTTDYLLGRTPEPAATGPNVDRLLRHAERMSAEDLDLLTDVANLFATRHVDRTPGRETHKDDEAGGVPREPHRAS